MTRFTLPKSGQDWPAIKREMDSKRPDDRPWYDPKMLVGGSYFGGTEVVEVANRAYQEFINYNALYARKAFPSLVAMERELLDSLLELTRAPQAAKASMTSGGTESLLLSVMAARDWASVHRPVSGVPELIVPHAAHPGFDKAAHLMGLRCTRVQSADDYSVDVNAVADAINDNTIMLVGSAPSYPYGVSDDNTALGALALKHNLWFHVDACHGGFILPFAQRLQYAVRPWDFAVDGVTSLSIDVHKLGYANKGVSALLLRDERLHVHQRYHFDAWPAGEYATDGITGSRSAGGLASAWAVARFLGEAGYQTIVADILASRDRLVAGINAIDATFVCGSPEAYLVAYGSDSLNAYAIADGMEARGWVQGRLKLPPAAHLFLDRSHTADVIDEYLSDLREVVDGVRSGAITAAAATAIYAT